MKTAAVVLGVLSGIGAGYVAGRYITPDRVGAAADGSNQRALITEHNPAEPVSPRTSSPQGGSAEPRAAHANRASTGERLRELARLKSSAQRAYEAELYFADLTVEEMSAAFAALQELPPGRVRYELLAQFFARWGELDGPAATEAANQLPARERWWAQSTALGGWAKLDPRAAWEAAKAGIVENGAGNFRGGDALRELARVDLAGAISEAGAMTSNTSRYMCRSAIIEAAAETGRFDALTNTVMQVVPPDQREEWVQAVFRRWGGLDTEAPMSALRTIADPNLAREAMCGLVAGWGELDPKGAMEFILENRDDPLIADSLDSTIGSTVAGLRESEIRTMVESMKASGSLDVVVPKMVRSMPMEHPRLAMELVETLSDEQERIRLTNTTMTVWAHTDFTKAAAFYEHMPGSPAKIEAFQGLSGAALQNTDGPTTIARWMTSFSGSDRAQAAQYLVRSLEQYQRFSPRPLPPEGAALLAQAINETSNLPPQILEQSRKLLQPPP